MGIKMKKIAKAEQGDDSWYYLDNLHFTKYKTTKTDNFYLRISKYKLAKIYIFIYYICLA